jgi:uncharacterized protein
LHSLLGPSPFCGEVGWGRTIGSRPAVNTKPADRRVEAAIGGLAGLAAGLLGVGGGFVIVPLLTIWSGFEQRRASGTSLAAIFPIAVVGAATYYLRTPPEIQLSVALTLILGSAAGAVVGSLAAKRVPQRALEMLVAVLLVVVGLYEIFLAVVGRSLTSGAAAGSAFGVEQYALLGLGGIVIGVLSGLAGIGGGIFIVPMLVLGFGVTQRVAQGTSLLAILPTAAIGAWIHHREGNMSVGAAATIAAVGAPAAVVGATLAYWLPQRALVGLFGAFLVLAATQTWPRTAKASSS